MKITVVGLGLIGASMAKGLHKKGHEVYGVDINKDSLEYCEREGIVTKGYSEIKDAVKDSQLIVFSVYPKIMFKLIEENIEYFAPGAVITDVGGVKREIVTSVQNIVPSYLEFVGAHPMGGREKIGPEYSDPDIFKNANFIITPTEKNSSRAIEIIETMANDLEFGKISHLTPERHDEMIAFTSQLTHAIAVALVNSDKDPDTYDFIGDSYRELTRIAMINENLWSELFLENKDYLINRIDDFQEKLGIIKTALKHEDSETLIEEFKKSTEKRLTLDK